MPRIRTSFRPASTGRRASPIATALVGISLVAVGLGLSLLIGTSLLRSLDTYRWSQTPATIQHCEILILDGAPQLDRPFELSLSYRYLVDGAPRPGHRLSLDDSPSSDYEKLALLRADLLSRTSLTAYVDPADPSLAILRRPSPWFVLLILFPLPFVAIGIGLLVHAARRRAAGDPAPTSLAASARSKAALHPAIAPAFCTLFILVGLGILFPLFVNPFLLSREARSWVETPAEVVWSRVTTHSGSDSTTYGIDIFYRYTVGDTVHHSGRHSFITGTSSGFEAKRRVVDQFPAGATVLCYVDPDRPERAVLDRSTSSIGFWFIIPLAFIAFGAVGFFSTLPPLLAQARHAGPRSSSSLRAAPQGRPGQQGPAQFKAGRKRLANLAGTLFITLFWNGIVGAFLSFAIADARSGDPPVFIFLFLIPFVLIGLALAGATLYTLLGLANPRTNLTLSPAQPQLGQDFTLRWQTHGGTGRLVDLSLSLEATERATYARGTNRLTDEAIIYRQALVTLPPGIELRDGQLIARIPAHLVASWKADNNEIAWSLKVQGTIKLGPDIHETYQLTVLPAPTLHHHPQLAT